MKSNQKQFYLTGGSLKKRFSIRNATTWLRLRIAFAARMLPLLMLLALPAVVQAQYNYTTNNGTITITKYIGSGGVVIIPGTINGLPVTGIGDFTFSSCTNVTSVTIPNSVTSIGDNAFFWCSSLTSVMIGNSVTNIGMLAFGYCYSLASVTIPDSVISIGSYSFGHCESLTSVTIPNSVTIIGTEAFYYCVNLTSVTIGNNVTSIGSSAFYGCYNLTNITIPNSVTDIGTEAFYYCYSLMGVYFKGNAPSVGFGGKVFEHANNVTIYYLAETMGWRPTFAYRPTKLWNPQVQTSDASFGVRTNRFGFTITGLNGLVIVVEACTDIVNLIWFPMQTNTLTGGSFYYSDPQWTNYPGRFYRLRSP